ncbi:hypothetical protein OPV22_017368 [Ensete ventricosum]|uniref:Uncharacterized protein n=1 Tax=Ensete ventricosum TaxID=4639 RepID=A0AAV8QW70_ENSVE|nr:hypothetical protein OPV22_017368 [Ensete ventricosum]
MKEGGWRRTSWRLPNQSQSFSRMYRLCDYPHTEGQKNGTPLMYPIIGWRRAVQDVVKIAGLIRFAPH